MAFGFARRAAAEGLTQSAALTAYRAGGGAIRTELWGDVFKTAFQAEGYREDIGTVPLQWAIPEHLFTVADIDWTSKFNFVAELEYYNTATKQWESKWIQAGSDVLLTRGEWREEALRRMVEEEASPAFDPERGVSWLTEEAWQRKWP